MFTFGYNYDLTNTRSTQYNIGPLVYANHNAAAISIYQKCMIIIWYERKKYVCGMKKKTITPRAQCINADYTHSSGRQIQLSWSMKANNTHPPTQFHCRMHTIN